MEIWKVKKNVDLKKLEKYGYKYNEWGLVGRGYLKDLKYNDFVFIGEDRIIVFEFEDVMDEEACELKAIADLIKADLVEKC